VVSTHAASGFLEPGPLSKRWYWSTSFGSSSRMTLAANELFLFFSAATK